MYEFILNTKLLTAMTAVLLAMLASYLVGRRRLWWRGLLLNFTPMFAAAFFVVAPFAPEAPNGFDLLSGLLFELAVLLLFFRLLKPLMGMIARTTDVEAARILRCSLILQVALALPTVATTGFGILSDGSRLDYLSAGASAKYLTYAGWLLSFVQTGFLAQRISRHGSVGWLGGTTIVVNFAFSILAGSKGGAFLWLISALALVDYERAKIRARVIWFSLCAAFVALFVTANVIASFLDISIASFLELAVSRFFLANDARSLAFDMRSSRSPDVGLLAESFRSLATVFGSPPVNPPLGVQLFGDLFGEANGNGANSSLMALIVYYSPAGYSLVAAVLATCTAIALYLAIDSLRRGMVSPGAKVIVSLLGLISLYQLSQDFLSFQIVMPVLCVMAAVVWLYDRKNIKSARRRISRSARSSFTRIDQRDSSGLRS